MLIAILHTKNGKVKGIYKNSYISLMTASPASFLNLNLPHPPKPESTPKRYGVGVASGIMVGSEVGVGEEPVLVVPDEKAQIVRTTAISAAMFGS